ncbi:MAG: WD40 repeat domain-containing protein [Treponema sp.]|nr:WD40 repeat domain-containing protein [Treponema sp.]
MKAKIKLRLVAGAVLFTVYFFCAARPIPLETVLTPRWLNAIEAGTPIYLSGSPARTDSDETDVNLHNVLPFSLGNRFGYISPNGHFSLNREKKANIALSRERWAEYEAEPDSITIHGNNGAALALVENPSGYPFFLDGRTFLIGSDQNVVSAINASGVVSWTYEFASPLTCIDSSAGFVLTGSLDGVISVLDGNGRQVFSFEPGGSQYAIILGCAISRDGSRLALVSGINAQRFLVLERFGANAVDYKVVYHEFLEDGFRRPVYIDFIEGDRWVVFERSGGLGFYEIGSRRTSKVALSGEIRAIEHTDGQGMIFAVISHTEPANERKELAGIRLPGRVLMRSPFKSEEIFLGRADSRLIVGGGQTLVSFDLERR